MPPTIMCWLLLERATGLLLVGVAFLGAIFLLATIGAAAFFVAAFFTAAFFGAAFFGAAFFGAAFFGAAFLAATFLAATFLGAAFLAAAFFFAVAMRIPTPEWTCNTRGTCGSAAQKHVWLAQKPAFDTRKRRGAQLHVPEWRFFIEDGDRYVGKNAAGPAI
jgi:uncharacterized protein YjbI with pentapeptide repeats